MGELNLEQLSGIYMDVLKEIGNIGAGNAATALAQMLQCKVDMKVPQVRLLDFKDVGTLMGGEEQIMIGIDLTIEGDITGSIMFMMSTDTGKHLCNKLMFMQSDTKEQEFSEMECSALQEVGNIITGSYLNSLASMTNLVMYPSVPSLCIDMAGAILSVPAIEFGALADNILLIQTQFFDEEELNGYFILVPDLESYPKILTSLGIQI
ncbi:MAG: chemotaxis protein CheC [Lachnospiraceae bacterium]|nr:chemotaxis protein CheC [Lachnospiraceae bacterium]